MYNRVPIGNNMVLCISKLIKKLDLILSVNHKTKTKGHKKTLGGVEYINYLNCGDGIAGVCKVPTYKLYTLSTHSSLYINDNPIKDIFLDNLGGSDTIS